MTLEKFIIMTDEEIRNMSEEDIYSLCIRKDSPEDEITEIAKKIALEIFRSAPIEMLKYAALATLLEPDMMYEDEDEIDGKAEDNNPPNR